MVKQKCCVFLRCCLYSDNATKCKIMSILSRQSQNMGNLDKRVVFNSERTVTLQTSG